MWAPAVGCEKTVVRVSYVCKISSYFHVHANGSRFSITAEVKKFILIIPTNPYDSISLFTVSSNLVSHSHMKEITPSFSFKV